MKERYSDDSNPDRVQVVITIVRQPTGVFSIKYMARQNFGPFMGQLSTAQSPTRLVWYIREIAAQPLLQMLLQEVAEKWGDELERVVVSPDELFRPLEPTKE